MRDNGNSIRLLYIEDEESLRDLFARMFEYFGYQVMCADDGQQGIEKAQNWQPDFILTDFCMPVMNGEQVIFELRSKPATSDIPIFVLSGNSNAETVSLQAGANQFFSKPANPYNLNLAIKETLAQSE